MYLYRVHLCDAQVLEVVRSNYELLTLKLPLGIDACERYNELAPAELAFFAHLVCFVPVPRLSSYQYPYPVPILDAIASSALLFEPPLRATIYCSRSCTRTVDAQSPRRAARAPLARRTRRARGALLE